MAQEDWAGATEWVGIGLRQPHYREVLENPPPLGFVEVHSENFMAAGGGAPALLAQIRRHHAVSLHGVGLGLGSAAGLDLAHLDALRQLVERTEPVRVSDHACFARVTLPGQAQVVHGADLLPLAYTDESMALLVRHVQQVQEVLKRPILIENLSAYLRFSDDAWPEPDFLNALCRRTGCQLLLDVNNLVVNAQNWPEADQPTAPGVLDWPQVQRWIDAIDPGSVGEIHLAGHRPAPSVGEVVIDDHSQCVNETVWAAYRHALHRLGPVPTLVEWDVDLPPLATLLAQAERAAEYLALCLSWGQLNIQGAV